MKPNLAELRAIAAATDTAPRPFDMQEVEVREAPAGSSSPGGVRFYCAVYDSLSHDLGGFRERIAPDAFDESLAEDDIRALIDHDRAKVIGRQKPDGTHTTASFTSDERGVLVDIPELPDTNPARDILELVRRGDIDGASFGFRTVEDRWDWEGTAESGIYVRTILKARILEGSIVAFPAYPETMAEARSIAAAIVEARAGKVLSAKSADALRTAIDTLRKLLEDAGEDARNEPTTDDAAARSDEPADEKFSLDLAKLRLRAHELAETSTPTP